MKYIEPTASLRILFATVTLVLVFLLWFVLIYATAKQGSSIAAFILGLGFIGALFKTYSLFIILKKSQFLDELARRVTPEMLNEKPWLQRFFSEEDTGPFQ